MELELIPWKWWILLGLVTSSLPLPLLNKISAGKNTLVKRNIAGVWGGIFFLFLIIHLLVFSKIETYSGVGKLLALMAILNGIGCFTFWAVKNWNENDDQSKYVDGRRIFRGIGLWLLIVIYPLVAGSIANRCYFKEVVTSLNQGMEEGFEVLLPCSVRECRMNERRAWVLKCRWREEEFRAEGLQDLHQRMRALRKRGARHLIKANLIKARVSAPGPRSKRSYSCLHNLSFVYPEE